MSKLHIITVATHDDGYFPVLVKQMKDAHIHYHILGYGQKWKGWTWRTQLILNYLKNHNPDDIVMVIDGYDVLVVGNEKDIIRKYNEFNTDIVFGIHLSLSQDFSIFVKYITHPIIRSYFKTNNEHMMNGGSFMGKAKTLIIIYEKMIKYCMETGTTDDQIALNNISLNGINYKLDVYSKIFWMWDIDSVYEIMYTVITKNQSSELNTVKKHDRRAIFRNGIQPEIIHGMGHRDMSMFVDPLLKFQHKKRPYAQDDMDYLINIIRCVIIIFILLLFSFSIYIYQRNKQNKNI